MELETPRNMDLEPPKSAQGQLSVSVYSLRHILVASFSLFLFLIPSKNVVAASSVPYNSSFILTSIISTTKPTPSSSQTLSTTASASLGTTESSLSPCAYQCILEFDAFCQNLYPDSFEGEEQCKCNSNDAKNYLLQCTEACKLRRITPLTRKVERIRGSEKRNGKWEREGTSVEGIAARWRRRVKRKRKREVGPEKVIFGGRSRTMGRDDNSEDQDQVVKLLDAFCSSFDGLVRIKTETHLQTKTEKFTVVSQGQEQVVTAVPLLLKNGTVTLTASGFGFRFEVEAKSIGVVNITMPGDISSTIITSLVTTEETVTLTTTEQPPKPTSYQGHVKPTVLDISTSVKHTSPTTLLTSATTSAVTTSSQKAAATNNRTSLLSPGNTTSTFPPAQQPMPSNDRVKVAMIATSTIASFSLVTMAIFFLYRRHRRRQYFVYENGKHQYRAGKPGKYVIKKDDDGGMFSKRKKQHFFAIHRGLGGLERRHKTGTLYPVDPDNGILRGGTRGRKKEPVVAEAFIGTPVLGRTGEVVGIGNEIVRADEGERRMAMMVNAEFPLWVDIDEFGGDAAPWENDYGKPLRGNKWYSAIGQNSAAKAQGQPRGQAPGRWGRQKAQGYDLVDGAIEEEYTGKWDRMRVDSEYDAPMPPMVPPKGYQKHDPVLSMSANTVRKVTNPEEEEVKRRYRSQQQTASLGRAALDIDNVIREQSTSNETVWPR